MLPDPSRTFAEVVGLHAERSPTAVGLHVVEFAGRSPVAQAYTYAQLLAMIESAARALAQHGVRPGQRVVLALSNIADFFSFFVGAHYIGAVPVPVPSLRELPAPAYANRIAAVLNDAKPYLTVVEDARAVGVLETILGKASARTAESLRCTAPISTVPTQLKPACRLDEAALLQYTSGSTGAPKGVVVLHSNLIANLTAISRGANLGAQDAIYSWLPLFHDMGLVAGLLLGIYLGIPTYVAQPRSFVNRPESWLRAISEFKATFSPGPNFAFDILARKVPAKALDGIDLSRWRLAFDGAELVDASTVHAFIERFAAHGFSTNAFRPAYGLAECTLAAAFPRPGVDLRFDCVERATLFEHGIAVPASDGRDGAILLASVGHAVPGHRIRILEVDGSRELAARQLGEITVSGPSVSPGYVSELAAGAPARTELRTGDLGYVADGQLYFVDRLKDLLVVAGRKYSPADIERLVGSIEGVRRSAVIAFSAHGGEGTEEAYVVAGLEHGAGKQRDDLIREIRSLLRDHLGLTPAEVFLVRPGILPRTSSGKVRRAACLAMLKAGAFGSRDSDA